MNDVKWICIPRERHLYRFSGCFQQNGVRFDAKRSAIWCKTQGKMVLNAVQNGAKRKAKSIKIRRNCINKTFKNHEILG